MRWPRRKGADDRYRLELFLARVPETTRASLNRPQDPSGRTVPPDFALRSPTDLLRLLPDRPLLFAPGHTVHGSTDWTLVRPLGVGGFGEVWQVRAGTLLGAMKFFRPDHAKELRHEERVVRRVMTAGPHPGIVGLLEADLTGPAPWLLYEYVNGNELRETIHAAGAVQVGGRVARTRDLLAQLARAVGWFHALDPAVVHRDLKPGNILIDRATGRPRVIDFGIGGLTAGTVATGDTTAALLTRFVHGFRSPVYASPQQIAGDPPRPTDDVHALGVIAYQLLTGKPAGVPGTDFRDELGAAGVPVDLISLIGACVAQDAARRPTDANDLLRRLEHPEADPVPRPSPSRRPAPPRPQPPARPRSLREDDEGVRRRRDRHGVGAGPVLALACLVLAVVVAMAGIAWKITRGRPEAAAGRPTNPEPIPRTTGRPPATPPTPVVPPGPIP